MISFDLETYLITPVVIAPKPVVAAFCTSDVTYMLRFPDALPHIERMLASDEVVCGANIAYDFGVICAHYPMYTSQVYSKYDRGLVFDVQIAAFLDHVAKGEAPTDSNPVKALGKTFKRFSLDACVAVYLSRLNAKENDAYRLRYGELDKLPTEQWPKEAKQYPLDDVKNTLDVAEAQVKVCANLQAIAGKSWTHQTHHARAAFAMQLGTIYGIKTDQPYIEHLQKQIEADYARERLEWQNKGLVRPDGKDNSLHIKRLVVEAYANGKLEVCKLCTGTAKVPSEKTGKPVQCSACGGSGYKLPPGVPQTKAGGVGTDQDTMQQSGNETLEAFYETSKRKKPLTTYIPLLKNEGKYSVHISPNALVETGRSSYKGAIQQIPRGGGIREAFVPAPGYVFCSNDYTALELCSLAQCCLTLGFKSKLAELINQDIDLHSYFGAKLMNISLDEFLERKKKKDKVVDGYRFGAKAVNFGLPGGMGAAKFIYTQRKQGVKFCVLFGKAERCGETKEIQYNGRDITPTCKKCLHIVERLKNEWFQTFPEIPRYFDWVKGHKGLKNNEAVLTAVGTGYIRGGLSFTETSNTNFQHLAAMGAKHALWNVSREMYCDTTSPLYGSKILIFVHDELFMEMPEDKASEAAFRAEKLMVDSMQEFIPDVKIKAPPALMRRWYKGADAVMKDGKLVPWEPKA